MRQQCLDGLAVGLVYAAARDELIDEVLAVPQDALQYSYGVYKVCLINGDVLKETEVKIGEISGDEAEIVSGAKAGARIAVPVKGQALKDGAKIQIVQ